MSAEPPSTASIPPEAKPKSAWARLPWYDRIWAALPLMLIMRGGLLGGLCGGLAWYLNQKILTGQGSRLAKYALCVLIDAGAVVLFLAIAIPTARMIGR